MSRDLDSTPNRLLPPDVGRFALCLTHDVDRPYRRLHQALYFAAEERSLRPLRSWFAGENPYWQFETIMDIEDDLGVRSAFYFLQSPAEWGLSPQSIVERLGRYEVTDPPIASVMRALHRGGWEVGVHGSLASAVDGDRLVREVEAVEGVIGDEVVGGRQHHLGLSVPSTWRAQSSAGLTYDASLGSSEEYGFQFGERPFQPVPDGPLVFPLTAMEVALPDPGERYEAALSACEALLSTAAQRRAVMTVLFHPRYFATREFPGYRRLYVDLVQRARELGAWIGPPRDLLAELGADVPTAQWPTR